MMISERIRYNLENILYKKLIFYIFTFTLNNYYHEFWHDNSSDDQAS